MHKFVSYGETIEEDYCELCGITKGQFMKERIDENQEFYINFGGYFERVCDAGLCTSSSDE